MNLIIINRDELNEESLLTLTDYRSTHIRKVLKSTPGSILRIGILNGPMGKGIVEECNGKQTVMRCSFNTTTPAPPKIDLILAMPRPKVLTRLLPQLSAIGVGRIVILRARKVERSYFDSHVLDASFYNARLIAGLQQACCTRLPEVLIRKRFKPFLEHDLNQLFPESLRLLANPDAKTMIGANDNRIDTLTDPQRILLAVGPEGGWNTYELKKLQGCNFTPVTMGDRILRTDTACVALLSVLTHMLSLSRMSSRSNPSRKEPRQ